MKVRIRGQSNTGSIVVEMCCRPLDQQYEVEKVVRQCKVLWSYAKILMEIWLPQYLQEGQHRRAWTIQEVSVGHYWWLPVELMWGRTVLDLPLTAREDWLGMLGWPWYKELQKHERVEQSKKQDLSPGLQDGRCKPVQRSLWKNPGIWSWRERRSTRACW